MPLDADSTITQLYRAAAGETTWTVALTSLMDDLGARGGQMVGVNLANGAISYSFASERVIGEIELEYVRKFHALDPRIPLLMQRPVGDWLIDQDAFAPDLFETNPYYCELLAPEDCRYSATMRAYQDANEVVLVAAVMPRTMPGFGSRERDYLQRIAPHFTEAMRLFLATRKLAAGQVAGQQMIERIKRPVIVIDESRRITLHNSAAVAILEEGEVLAERSGRLAALDPADEVALTLAVTDLLHAARKGEAGARRVARLHGDRSKPLAASLIAFDPPTSMHAFGLNPQILVGIHGLRSAPAPDLYLWQATFDFTPAEARIAAMIFAGSSVAKAAEDLGIRHSTAKSQLDAVFRKTNTGKQAELVKVLMGALD